MDDTFTSSQGIMFRSFTASLRADRTTEQHIIAFRLNFTKSIDGFAYALHDKDHYTVAEVADWQKRYDEILASGGTPDFDVPKVGDPKPAHWHIVCTLKNSISLDKIAKLLNCEPYLICKLYNPEKSRLGGFGHMLAYLLHITRKARADGKHEYDSSIVKGLQFPKNGKNAELYKDFKTYADFQTAYESDAISKSKDDYLIQISKGLLTPTELEALDPLYSIKNAAYIRSARLVYLGNLPTPEVVTNCYIGPTAGEKQRGRTGKSKLALMRAQVILAHVHRGEGIDFFNMSEDELSKYIYWTGGDGVELQNYDGQEIVIWEDIRASSLIRAFKGVHNVFKAIDTHPKPIAFNIKYSHTYLKNSFNIFDGIEHIRDFVMGLAETYTENGTLKTDITQALGRISFEISVSADEIVQCANLDYIAPNLSYMNYSQVTPNIIPDVFVGDRAKTAAEILFGKDAEIEMAIRNPELASGSRLSDEEFEKLLVPKPCSMDYIYTANAGAKPIDEKSAKQDLASNEAYYEYKFWITSDEYRRVPQFSDMPDGTRPAFDWFVKNVWAPRHGIPEDSEWMANCSHLQMSDDRLLHYTSMLNKAKQQQERR